MGALMTDGRQSAGRSLLMTASRYTEVMQGVCTVMDAYIDSSDAIHLDVHGTAVSLTNSEQMNVCRPGGGKEQRNHVSMRSTASIVERCETMQSVSN